MTTHSCDWQSNARAINQQQGTHHDLAKWVENWGFEVLPNYKDTERSWICRPGPGDAVERRIGEIVGDDDAIVVISASTN